MIRSFWKACAALWVLDFLVAVGLSLSQTWFFNNIFTGHIDGSIYDAVQNAAQFALFIGLFLIPIVVKYAMPAHPGGRFARSARSPSSESSPK